MALKLLVSIATILLVSAQTSYASPVDHVTSLENGTEISEAANVPSSAHICVGATIGDLVKVKDGVYVGPSCKVTSESVLGSGLIMEEEVQFDNAITSGSVLIGENSYVRGQTELTDSEIGSRVFIGQKSKIVRSRIGSKSYIEGAAIIVDSVLSQRVFVHEPAELNNIYVGENVKIYEGVHLLPNTVIGKDTVVFMAPEETDLLFPFHTFWGKMDEYRNMAESTTKTPQQWFDETIMQVTAYCDTAFYTEWYDIMENILPVYYKYLQLALGSGKLDEFIRRVSEPEMEQIYFGCPETSFTGDVDIKMNVLKLLAIIKNAARCEVVTKIISGEIKVMVVDGACVAENRGDHTCHNDCGPKVDDSAERDVILNSTPSQYNEKKRILLGA